MLSNLFCIPDIALVKLAYSVNPVNISSPTEFSIKLTNSKFNSLNLVSYNSDIDSDIDVFKYCVVSLISFIKSFVVGLSFNILITLDIVSLFDKRLSREVLTLEGKSSDTTAK